MFGKKPDETFAMIEKLAPLVIKYLLDKDEAARKFEMELLKTDKDYALKRLEVLTAEPKEDLMAKIQSMAPGLAAMMGGMAGAGGSNG